MRDHARHARIVDAWLGREAVELTSEQLLVLVAAGLDAVWGRTRVTIGEVTLVAIAERVLHDVSARFPAFASLMVEADGFVFRELLAHATTLRESEAREGGRFLVVELLTVLGNLTAEILTPDLHARLGRATLPEAARGKRGRANVSAKAPEDKPS